MRVVVQLWWVEWIEPSKKTVLTFPRYNERLQEAKLIEEKRGFTYSISLGIIYFLIFFCYAICFW